jgi:hypothetical protein
MKSTFSITSSTALAIRNQYTDLMVVVVQQVVDLLEQVAVDLPLAVVLVYIVAVGEVVVHLQIVVAVEYLP